MHFFPLVFAVLCDASNVTNSTNPIHPVGSFLTLRVFSHTAPKQSGNPRIILDCYAKRDGSPITAEDLERFEYIQLLTHEEHSNDWAEKARGGHRRARTLPTAPVRRLINMFEDY